MIAVFYGAAGAILVLAVLSLGICAGWKARERLGRPAAAQEENEEEQRRFREQQRAFEDMLHYNIDTAYGRGDVLSRLAGGEDD